MVLCGCLVATLVNPSLFWVYGAALVPLGDLFS